MKVITLNNLRHYTDLMKQYIDDRIKAHNNVIILKECSACGAREFKTEDHCYICAYCGSVYRYQTLCDHESKAS